jgi:hypothetical protein
VTALGDAYVVTAFEREVRTAWTEAKRREPRIGIHLLNTANKGFIMGNSNWLHYRGRRYKGGHFYEFRQEKGQNKSVNAVGVAYLYCRTV